MEHSVFGFAARVVGGNPRAARLSGLAVPRLVILTCCLGGAAAGLAGMVEVAAIRRDLDAHRDAHPSARIGPLAVNLATNLPPDVLEQPRRERTDRW